MNSFECFVLILIGKANPDEFKSLQAFVENASHPFIKDLHDQLLKRTCQFKNSVYNGGLVYAVC